MWPIRDERHDAVHGDYVHMNPVKYELAASVRDWPHSSFHRCVAQGVYSPDWGVGGVHDLSAGERGA